MSLTSLHPNTIAFLQRAPRMLIGGRWVEAADGQTMSLRNPATGEELCVVPRATADDVDRAVLSHLWEEFTYETEYEEARIIPEVRRFTFSSAPYARAIKAAPEI